VLLGGVLGALCGHLAAARAAFIDLGLSSAPCGSLRSILVKHTLQERFLYMANVLTKKKKIIKKLTVLKYWQNSPIPQFAIFSDCLKPMLVYHLSG